MENTKLSYKKLFMVKNRDKKMCYAGAATGVGTASKGVLGSFIGAAISLDFRIPTCLSGATSLAWL